MPLRATLLLILLLAPALTPPAAADSRVRIGVLSHRGVETTLAMWSPTAEYLGRALEGFTFEIVALDFDEVDPAVQYGQVDFLLVNPGIYVNMEVKHRVSRIATLNNLGGGAAHNVFGGVIFTRSDRNDIGRLADLKGRRFMAVDRTSLGGFQMAWREMEARGIDPERDLAELRFGGIHDRVVEAVLAGEVDAGTVRTDILERMSMAGAIDLDDVKVLEPRIHPEFLLKRSTRLYPEWPFSKLQHTSNELAQRVAIALMNLPAGHPAARAGRYAGWTIPLDYQPVHDLFRELNLAPYQEQRRFTLADAVKKYWYWLVLAVVFLLLMAALTTWAFRLNRELTKAKLRLERQHNLILNSVADGIYGVDRDGNSTFVNRAMEEITGWRAEELIGYNQHERLHHTRGDGSPHPANECPVYLTFRDNRARFVDDDLFWRRDGTSFPVEYSSTPLRDDRGEVVGSVVVFRDTSERKRAQEAARRHQLEMAHVTRLSTMGEMASGIAHELNQPLTVIATSAQACVRMIESGDCDSERVADVLEKIGLQAERAGGIIRHLRQFVRKEQPELSLVNLNDLVDEVIELVRPEARAAAVTIETDLDPDLPSVTAQHIQIDQVILNLARNAIEAMAEFPVSRKLLTISTRTGGRNAVIVTVSDTGPGLSEEILDDVFNPFVTTKRKGMGLGLSISKGIIEAHKGNLYLERSGGMGAVFRFTLPVGKGESDE